ncbi:MAG: hypothetical protein ACKO2L_16415 [Planctomycetaceae bacterium]
MQAACGELGIVFNAGDNAKAGHRHEYVRTPHSVLPYRRAHVISTETLMRVADNDQQLQHLTISVACRAAVEEAIDG